MDDVTSNSTSVSDTLLRTSQKPPGDMTILVTVVPIATIALNLPTVALIIVSAFQKKELKHFHFLSLGITDLSVGISSYLMADTYKNRSTPYLYYNCWFRYYLFTISISASLLHVLGICIQRVRIIRLKIKSQSHQSVVQWSVIIVSWVLSLSLFTPPFIVWNRPHTLLECSIDTIFTGNERKFSYYSGSVFSIVLLAVVVTMCFLFKLLWVHRRKLSNNSWSKKDIRLCATVVILAILFTICTLPLNIALLCYDFLDHTRRTVRSICTLFALVNSIINPLIYILRVPEFKGIIKERLLCCKSNQVAPTDNDAQN